MGSLKLSLYRSTLVDSCSCLILVDHDFKDFCHSAQRGLALATSKCFSVPSSNLRVQACLPHPNKPSAHCFYCAGILRIPMSVFRGAVGLQFKLLAHFIEDVIVMLVLHSCERRIWLLVCLKAMSPKTLRKMCL